MALVKCSECGKEMSDKTTNCPRCSYPIEKTIKCPYCNHDTNKTYKQIQELGYKISCSNCGKDVEVSTPEQETIWGIQKIAQQNIPKCPTCGSTDIKPISGTERAVSVIGLGLLSKKINKSFKCKNCGGTF